MLEHTNKSLNLYTYIWFLKKIRIYFGSYFLMSYDKTQEIQSMRVKTY